MQVAFPRMRALPRPARTPDQFLTFGAQMNGLGIALALLLLPVPAAVQGVGTVTLLEGPLRVIRGASVVQGAEGMRLRQGDILESSDKGFAQLEFNGGGIVALGPSTRVYILRHDEHGSTAGGSVAAKATPGAELILLSGWLKGESSAAAGLYRYATPILAATTGNGTVLVHEAAAACDVFVESGSAVVGEVGPDGGVHQGNAAKAGQFFSRSPGKAVTTSSRPNAAFLDEMPHPFRDTLPSRLARFTGRPVEPKADHAVSYAEVQAYLRMTPAWRRGFVDRFETRLKDAEFRKQLESHLAEHPEWDKILHPEKQPESRLPPASTFESADPKFSYLEFS
jgi:hypothetical protein